MSTDADTGNDGATELDALATDELRARAFHKAERGRDLGFFWDLVKHLQASEEAAADDGSAGGLGEGVTAAVELVTELIGRRGNEMEPLLRARYIDYLRTG
jgi:hypothetical protein